MVRQQRKLIHPGTLLARSPLESARMNTGNAWGFVFLGLAMSLLPVIAPGSFPATGIDGSSARALWVEVMGAIQLVIGTTYLIRHSVVPAVVRWLNTEPARPAVVLEPVAPLADVLPFGAAPEPAGVFAAARLEPDGAVTLRGHHAALWRSLQAALRDKERLAHFLERLRHLARLDRDPAHSHESVRVFLTHHAQRSLLHLVQAGALDLEELKRRGGDWLRDPAVRALLGKIDQMVGETRRAA